MSGPRLLPADDTAIAEAANALRQSQVVAFPTETVYGLGGGTLDPRALQMIYELKGRPSDNPLIAHVTGPEAAGEITTGWDDRCSLLAEAWWPGPLTLVLGRAAHVPDLASGGRPTLAVRSPEHPVARSLLDAYGGPISAPSANRSGAISPTQAQHVLDDFAGRPEADGLIVLGGDRCSVGIESTVLDMTVDPPRILRPGVLTAEVLRPLLGEVEMTALQQTSASPGTMERHYAPQTPCLLVDEEELQAHLSQADRRCVVITSSRRSVSPPHVLIEMPADPKGYAAELYAALRQADAERVDVVLVESAGEDDPNWIAIRDRLMRAASDRGS
ncbi:MAG: threonylcarbamoyl-AMP synthase [Phycisphaerales bacterium]|nr:threonylcarbamoyl-AMP synthase [Phycisphaerales bacterium]